MANDPARNIDADERRTIVCPKCGAAMEKVTFKNIKVDRCTSCKGLWFDMLEREHLQSMKGSEVIDTGPVRGEKKAKTIRIKCPTCHTPMIQMVDIDHPNIKYESCKVCYGVFFDAGEFRQVKENGVLGFFRDLFNRK